ncbi:MAG: YfhO family protein [Ignavibacteriae bacterium]|nr:YfhO family protein [Ignavibacteriota bacterium]
MLSSLFKKYPTTFPLTLLVLMIVVPYWKLAFMQGFVITDDIFTSDIMNEGFPYRYYMSEALKNGELPIWMPGIYGGMPLLARAEAGVCYPFNLLLFGLLSPYVALNLTILLTLIIAAATMYFFLREIEASTVAAMIGGLAFAYSGFMVSHIKHLSMVGTVSWFPLGLLVIERALRKSNPRALLALAAVFGLQNLSGHIQTAYYSGVFYIVYFLFGILRLRTPKRQPRKKSKKDEPTRERSPMFALAMWFGLAMLIAVGISAVQVLPTYELVGMTQRSGGVTFDYASNYAYDPSNFKTFFYAHANGDIADASYRGESVFWEDYGYVGIIPMLVALYAAIRFWRRWHVRFFAITAVVAYVFVLGPHTPIYEGAFHLIPGMKFFRFPTRFLFVVDASVIVLASLGLTEIFKKQRSDLIEIGALVLVAADLLFFQLRENPIVDAAQWLDPPATVRTISADKALFRIFSPGGSETHKAAFTDARGWSGDLQPYITQREFIQVSSNVLYGLSSADGYAQLTPNYVVDIWGDQNKPGMIYKTASVVDGQFIPQSAFLNIMNLFNVKYLLSPWPISSEKLKKLETYSGAHLYRNDHALPRAFLVGHYRHALSSDAAIDILLSSDFDPSREAIVEPSLHRDTTSTEGAVVSVERYATNRVNVNVASSDGGMLVLSDTHYPGWKAYIDGVESPIHKVNLSQRGVLVPGGTHEVTFSFESDSIRWGFIATISSIVVLIILGMIGVRRRA